jgi:hypothetical protein
MTSCGVCESENLEAVLDLGPQAVSSHFTAKAGERTFEQQLKLACCLTCGSVQLAQPFPFRQLVPPYDWISYREPEAHLDEVVEKICALPGVDSKSSVVALSFKDLSTLERLNRRNFQNTRLIDPYKDLNAGYPNANIESVPGLLTTERARQIIGGGPHADVLIARHVLEHAESCRGFLAAMSEMVRPEGYLVIEVPECGANMVRRDYAMIWEEHAVYFTQATLANAVNAAGFCILGIELHRYPFEDVFVLYARKAPPSETVIPMVVSESELVLARGFGAEFREWSQRYDTLLSRLTSDGRKIAAYGAGHLTCAFIHFHRLERHFAFVVDDTPQKQGLFLPKSGLPIVPRDRLTADKIAACLFGLGPQTEDKIIANNRAYVEAGGTFLSMLADSEHSIRTIL